MKKVFATLTVLAMLTIGSVAVMAQEAAEAAAPVAEETTETVVEEAPVLAVATETAPESVTETVAASKTLISQNIGRVMTIVEVYRDKPRKSKEVRVVIFYNAEMALQSAKKAIRSELEKKGDKIHEQLDKALGF